jgi:nitrogen fixation NifU-like protein
MILSDAERSMLIEELARTPRALLETHTHEGFARTASCGDEVTIRARVAGTEIQELGWNGHGCTVSMAATAALARLAPIAVSEFRAHFARYVESVNGTAPLEGDLEAFAGIGRFPLRGQCATLAWRALSEALAD